MFRTWNDTVRMPVDNDDDDKGDLSDVNCDLCADGPWVSETEAEIHRRRKHKKRLLISMKQSSTMCSACFRKQPSEKDLFTHIKSHHLLTTETSHIEHKTYICNDCNRLFFNKNILTAHIWHFHIPKTPQKKKLYIECPKCLKDVRLSNCFYHFLHQGLLTINNCPICSKYIRKQKYLIDHLKTHTAYFHCDICGYDTKKPLYFNNHMLRHRKNKNSSNITDVSRYFCLSKHYYTHLLWGLRFTNIFRGLSIPIGVQICILCRAIFDASDEARMLEHIQVDHSPLAVEARIGYGCVCGERFDNKILLKQHVFKLKGEHKEAESLAEDNKNEITDQPSEMMSLEEMLLSAANNDICYEIEIADVLAGTNIPNTNNMSGVISDSNIQNEALKQESSQLNSNLQVNSENSALNSEAPLTAKSIIENFSMESY